MIYLIPTTLGDTPIDNVLPRFNAEVIRSLHFFVVENIRSARRFLKQVDREIPIDDLTFYELNQHTDINSLFAEMRNAWQYDIGIISEAGCPAVADPGALIVAEAHRRKIKVKPLVGPSSILMSVMASGFNGQSFAFNGYLPIEKNNRSARLKTLEHKAHSEHQTQVFIETPYRNVQMVDELCHTLQPKTMLCIACSISTDDEYIETLSIAEWRKLLPLNRINKKPTIFLIG